MALGGSETGGGSGGGVATLNRVGERSRAWHDTQRITPERQTRSWRGERADIRNPEGKFSKETTESFYNNTANELNNLLSVWHNRQDGGPAIVQRMLAEPEFHPYKVFFERFTEDKPDVDNSGVPVRSVKADELRAYLQTEPGMMDAIELRMIKIEEIAEQSGVLLDTSRGTPRQEAVENSTAMLQRGGALYELGRRIGYSITRDRLNGGGIPGVRTRGQAVLLGAAVTGGNAALGAVLGSLGSVGGPVGALLGTGVGVAASAAAYSLRPGHDMTIEQSHAALSLAQYDNPAQPGMSARAATHREMSRRMWGVDANNLVPTPDGIALRPDIAANMQLTSPSQYFDTMREVLFAEAEAVRKAQSEIGVRNDLQGVDNVGLGPDRMQFADRGLSMENKVRTELKRTLRDNNGNPCQVFIGRNNEWVDNTYANAGRFAAEFTAQAIPGPFELQNTNPLRLRLERRAIHRRFVTQEMHQHLNEFDNDKVNPLGNLRREIDRARTRVGNIEARTTQNRNTSTLIEQANVAAENLRSPFDTLNTALDHLDQLNTAAVDQRGRVTGIPVTTPPTSEADWLQAVYDDTNRPGGTPPPIDVRINGRRFTSIGGQLDAEDARYEAALLANPLNEAALERTHQERRSRIEANGQVLMQQIDAIRDADEAVTNGYRNLRSNAEIQRNIQNGTADMRAARTTIESWTLGGATPINLNLVDLQTQSYDELVRRINAASVATLGATPPILNIGWPAGENNFPQHREQLVRAMAEARAVGREPRIVTPGADFTTLTNPGGFAFSETELLVLSAD